MLPFRLEYIVPYFCSHYCSCLIFSLKANRRRLTRTLRFLQIYLQYLSLLMVFYVSQFSEHFYNSKIDYFYSAAKNHSKCCSCWLIQLRVNYNWNRFEHKKLITMSIIYSFTLLYSYSTTVDKRGKSILTLGAQIK